MTTESALAISPPSSSDPPLLAVCQSPLFPHQRTCINAVDSESDVLTSIILYDGLSPFAPNLIEAPAPSTTCTWTKVAITNVLLHHGTSVEASDGVGCSLLDRERKANQPPFVLNNLVRQHHAAKRYIPNFATELPTRAAPGRCHMG
jgi:hypothetical protein